MLSSATPRPCTEKSLAYVIETSTLRVELFVFGRVTDQCSQPSLGPLMAFHVPLEPVGMHESSSSSGVVGSPGLTTNTVR